MHPYIGWNLGFGLLNNLISLFDALHRLIPHHLPRIFREAVTVQNNLEIHVGNGVLEDSTIGLYTFVEFKRGVGHCRCIGQVHAAVVEFTGEVCGVGSHYGSADMAHHRQ